MKRVLLTLFVLFPLLLEAQVFGPVDSRYNSIRQNGVSTMAAFGDTLWISPSLNRNIANQADWYTPENADSVTEGIGRVFSLALGRDTVVAGLGYTNTDAVGSPHTGYGYYFSVDGGENWRYEPHPLDEDPPERCNSNSADFDLVEYDPECGIDFQYGGKTYNRIRFTVPEQAPPYEVSFKGNTVFSANFGASLLRSTDFGSTWERVLLPPDQADSLAPEQEYFWDSTFRNAEGEALTINRYDPRSDVGLNLRVFSTEIDSDGNVWVGTGNGVNISDNALTAPSDSIRWAHKTFDGTSNGLIGNWVIEIKEDPATGRVWMTNRAINSETESRGLVYTQDGGETFVQVLVGEQINGMGFKDGYVYAAGSNGLFISPDGGDTWVKSPQIKSPNTFIKSSATFYSVASTTDRVWIGTDDGIASTDDNAQSWQITRVDFPLQGGNVHDPEARSVNTYAYPNPFSPSMYDVVRVKFEVKNQGNVHIRIFDLGMNLVREIENDSFAPGIYEAVWDGLDSKGRKVANAPYIYVIEMAERTVNGKILLVD